MVNDFGTNPRCMCDFLIVINSNFGPILHSFWDMATCWWKIAYFFLRLSHSAFPLEFCGEVNHEETRGMGLLCGESCM